MTKMTRILQVCATLLLPLLLVQLVAANHVYESTTPYSSAPSYRSTSAFPTSNFGATSRYRESPGYERFPTTNTQFNRGANMADTNYDSSNYGSDYRGPMYERTVSYVDDFSRDISSRSGFFTSRSSDSLRHHVSSTLTEKYVGESQSMFYNTQNRQAATSAAQDTSSQKTDDGFRFGKARAFDSSEYQRNSYTDPYYYRPAYNSNDGYFNWRW